MKTKSIIAGMFIAGAMASSSAYAADCTCVTTANPDGSIGKILSASGDVRVSGAQGYQKAASGAKISTGEISIGSSSSARVLVGQGCSLNAQANSVISVTKTVSGKLCVASTTIGFSSESAAAAPSDGGGGALANVLVNRPGTVFAVFGGAVGTTFAVQESNRNVGGGGAPATP